MKTVIEERKQCRGLDIAKLKNRMIGTISSEEALKDIEPFDWSTGKLSEVLNAGISNRREEA